MLKSKIRQLKQKETKKVKQHSDESLNNSAAPSPMEVLSPPDGVENKEDGVALEMTQEGQQATEGKKKRKVSKKKEDTKDEGEKVCNNVVLVQASLDNSYLYGFPFVINVFRVIAVHCIWHQIELSKVYGRC